MRTRQRNIGFIFRNPLQEKLQRRFYTFCTNGPFSNFNPTSSLFQDAKASLLQHLDELTLNKSTEEASPRQISYQWTSRNNRKGLHVIVVFPSRQAFESSIKDVASSRSARLWRGVCRMFKSCPFWDISYLIAILFTIGSLAWIVDGIITFLPLAYPYGRMDKLFDAGSILAFAGTTILFVASILQWLEIVNENRTVCFGWSINDYYDNTTGRRSSIRKGFCSHHHCNSSNLCGTASTPAEPCGGETESEPEQNLELTRVATETEKKAHPRGASWSVLPTYRDLREYHVWNIGFYATLIQIFSSLIFYMTAVARLPSIYDQLPYDATIGLVWVPKIVGGLGFTVSAWLFMVETQPRWWIAAPHTLGWHIGALGVVGGIGFIVSPCLTIHGAEWAEYWASLCTILAGLAYFISALISWYESLEKHSVSVASEPIVEDDSESDGDFVDAEKAVQLDV